MKQNTKTLAHVIYQNFLKMALVAVICILSLFVIETKVVLEHNARVDASKRFTQIERILSLNQKELTNTKKSYEVTCANAVKIVSYILRYHPEARKSPTELKKIAKYLELDEIHIFNKKGVIIQGTNPEYYGYSFDSGKQMRFFKKMLKNKKLVLVQKAQPNTSQGKIVQYSACWDDTGSFIVEVGKLPSRLLAETKKNSTSYVFNLLKVSSDMEYFAINKKTKKVEGSTLSSYNGKKLSSLSLTLNDLKNAQKGAYYTIDGKTYYCMAKKSSQGYLLCVTPAHEFVNEIVSLSAMILIGLLSICVLLALLIRYILNKEIISPIVLINAHLDELGNEQFSKIDLHNCLEFEELSHHINLMSDKIGDHVKDLSYQSYHDQLTGAYNHAALEKKINSLKESDEKLTILYCDLNGLKKINDQYGHDAGDHAIISLSGALSFVFGSDVYRNGGDEFIAFTSVVDEKKLKLQMDNLRHFATQRQISVSIGAVTCIGKDLQKAMKQADEKMYQDKQAYYQKHHRE